MTIVLASTSPRRIEMMDWLQIPFTPVGSEFDEKSIRDPDPEVLTQKLSKAKALSVSKDYPDAIVIGSDSVVSFEGQILEKATDINHQRELIKMHRGKAGKIITSVYIINTSDGSEKIKTVTVPYQMADVSDDQIESYIKSGKGADKAGGFGLQDFDGMFIESITGCYPSALGFPICIVSDILKEMGIEIKVDIKKLTKEKTGKDC